MLEQSGIHIAYLDVSFLLIFNTKQGFKLASWLFHLLAPQPPVALHQLMLQGLFRS